VEKILGKPLKKLSILVITNHFHPENFRINDLALGLRERGHEVTVFTGVPDYPEGKFFKGYGIFRRRRETWQGIEVVRFPLIPRGRGTPLNLIINYLSSAFLATLVAPFFCRGRFDLIFVFETSPVTIGLPAIFLKKLRKTPIIFWILDLWPESLSATGAVRSPFLLMQIRRLTSLIYRSCDRILVSSKGFIGSVKDTGGYTGEIGYFPNWIEPEYFSPVVAEDVKLPELPQGFRILFAGNIGVAQDFETILNAAELLRSHTDVHWIIFGDGRRADWVREQVKERCLEDSFHLLGKYPANMMPAFFAQASALLVTLRRDPTFTLTVPGKIQSYMSCGRPIIAALDGEGAQIIEESGCGLICPAESPQALANRILELYLMPSEERQIMADRGRQYSVEHFNRETLFSNLEDVMHSVIRLENNSCSVEVID
jgi:glycosyltransferase involved in cell wall biosynthesis